MIGPTSKLQGRDRDETVGRASSGPTVNLPDCAAKQWWRNTSELSLGLYGMVHSFILDDQPTRGQTGFVPTLDRATDSAVMSASYFRFVVADSTSTCTSVYSWRQILLQQRAV
eukprot:5488544-Pleurochrysis_carterae.AAC.1